MCYLGISDAMQTSLIRTIKTILFIQPIVGRYEAILTAYRLHVFERWINQSHNNIVRTLDSLWLDAQLSDRIPNIIDNSQLHHLNTRSTFSIKWTKCYTYGYRHGDRTGLDLYFLLDKSLYMYTCIYDHYTYICKKVSKKRKYSYRTTYEDSMEHRL